MIDAQITLRANTYVRFECGQEDRMGEDLGPFTWVQLTYTTIRAGHITSHGTEGEYDLAHYDKQEKMWIDIVGNKWSDVVIYGQ